MMLRVNWGGNNGGGVIKRLVFLQDFNEGCHRTTS